MTTSTAATNAATWILYGYYRSSSTMRVRCVLNLKHIQYQRQIISVIAGSNISEEYKKINPMQSVPALVHIPSPHTPPRTLIQSLAICDYINDIQPDQPLYPSDPYMRARCRALVNIIVADTQPIQNSRILEKVKHMSDDEMSRQWAADAIVKGLTAYEAYVGETAGTYSFGDDVTMADVYLVSQYLNAERYAADVSHLHTTKGIVDRLMKLQPVIDALPQNQSDAT